MSLLSAAVATLLTVTVNGIPQSTTVLPDEGACAKAALQIYLNAPSRGPVVSGECTPLGPTEPEKPASAPPAPKKKE